MKQIFLVGSKWNDRMLPRKLSRTELLLVLTAGGMLVLGLAIPRGALVNLIALAFEIDITMTAALISLVVLAAIAAVGIGYGIGLQNSTERPGKSEVLFRRRRADYGRHRR
jgi:membrane protein DedA with SNARE-associated domain